MAVEQPAICISIQLNPGDHAHERDEQARALCHECADLPGVEFASLDTAPGEGGERGDPLQVGQLALAIAPAAAEYVFARIAAWQRREPARREKIIIVIGERRAEFPEDIDSERLAALIRAVEKGE